MVSMHGHGEYSKTIAKTLEDVQHVLIVIGIDFIVYG